MNLIEWDFPREVGELSEMGGYRKLVRDVSDLERYWEGKNGRSNAFTTVYGFRGTQAPNHRRCDYNTAIIRHFVLDFDAQRRDGAYMVPVELDEVLEQVVRLHDYLIAHDIMHGVWWSGGGFHVWVKLAQTFMPASGAECSAVKAAGR